jgi:hypothetical protein
MAEKEALPQPIRFQHILREFQIVGRLFNAGGF